MKCWRPVIICCLSFGFADSRQRWVEAYFEDPDDVGFSQTSLQATLFNQSRPSPSLSYVHMRLTRGLGCSQHAILHGITSPMALMTDTECARPFAMPVI